MTAMALCGKPTPSGQPCRRKVRSPGGPCGAAHPDPRPPTGTPAAAATAVPTADPLTAMTAPAASRPEGQNDRRADRASATLAFFTERAYDGNSEETETAIADLLSDLRHLARRYGVDIDRAWDLAESNWSAEDGDGVAARQEDPDYDGPPASGGLPASTAWPPPREGGWDDPARTARTLRRLAGGTVTDDEWAALIAGPETPGRWPDTLTGIDASDPDTLPLQAARAAAITNPNCPPRVLAWAAAGHDPELRDLAAGHPNCPPEGRSAAGLLA